MLVLGPPHRLPPAPRSGYDPAARGVGVTVAAHGSSEMAPAETGGHRHQVPVGQAWRIPPGIADRIGVYVGAAFAGAPPTPLDQAGPVQRHHHWIATEEAATKGSLWTTSDSTPIDHNAYSARIQHYPVWNDCSAISATYVILAV